MDRVSKGKAGEDLALEYLKEKGYKILERNFYSRFGEIDIVAQDGPTLVFVEVKTRWSKTYGRPEESITPKKLNSIIKTSQYYKLLNPNLPNEQRIDMVAVDLETGEGANINLIKNVSF